MYTTPLSTLISLSHNHHLCADDTQLFFSLYPPNFDSCITHLQNALQQISSWMTAILLTLNSSKTEFILIGLRKQLDKIHNSLLNTTHSACNLGFIFDEHLTFSDQILAISKSCYYHIIIIVLTLIPTQLAPLPPPSFTPNSITVILSTTTYLSLRSTASSRSRTLLPVLLLKLLNAVTSLLSYTLFIGSK